MAVDIADKRQARFDWVGLSGDTKPTTGAYGSTFFATDTGLLYIYSAAGWTVKTLPVILPAGDLNIGNVDIVTMPDVVLTAGERHLGKVGGNTLLPTVTPTITPAAYDANDVIAGIQTFANAVRVSGGTGIIQSLVVSDLANQKAVLEIYLFSANPAAGTYTDNTALDIHDTDALLCIGRLDVAAGDYKSLADNAIACITGIGLAIKLAATSLYAIIRTISAPTYVGASDLKLTLGILSD